MEADAERVVVAAGLDEVGQEGKATCLVTWEVAEAFEARCLGSGEGTMGVAAGRVAAGDLGSEADAEAASASAADGTRSIGLAPRSRCSIRTRLVVGLCDTRHCPRSTPCLMEQKIQSQLFCSRSTRTSTVCVRSQS